MMRRAFTRIFAQSAIFACTIAVLRPHDAAGQAQSSLAAAAREAAKNFQASAPQEVANAKAALATAVENLDRFLRRSASAAVTKSWKDHLHWNDLVALAQKDQPGSN